MKAIVPIENFSHLMKFIEVKEKNKLVLFRGQANDYQLLPKIARKNPKIDSLEKEQKMLNDLKRRSSEFLKTNLRNDWDWLALGQHHGLFTRLLDWTTNPLIAAWFACSSKNIEDDYSVLWIYNVPDNALLNITKDKSPFDYGKTKVFQPNLVGKRIITQSGWFTVHKYSRTNSPKQYVAFENNREQSKYLIKLVIPKNLRFKFIEILNTCGINESTIFPELDGLCKHINWSYLN